MRTSTALLLTLLCSPALAQDYRPEDVPEQIPQEEVAKRVNGILDACAEHTVELEGVAKLTYKRIPTDVHAVAVEFAKTLSSKQVPRGVAPEIYVRQYEPQIGRLLEERFAQVASFEALAPLKIQRKDVPVGTYAVGIAFRQERPAAFVLSGEDLPKGKPVAIKLKLRRAEEDEGLLVLELVEPDEQQEGAFEFSLQATLRGAVAEAKKPFEQVLSE